MFKINIEEGIYPKGTNFNITDEFYGDINLKITEYNEKNKKYKLKVLHKGKEVNTALLNRNEVNLLVASQTSTQVGQNRENIKLIQARFIDRLHTLEGKIVDHDLRTSGQISNIELQKGMEYNAKRINKAENRFGDTLIISLIALAVSIIALVMAGIFWTIYIMENKLW